MDQGTVLVLEIYRGKSHMHTCDPQRISKRSLNSVTECNSRNAYNGLRDLT